MTVILHQFPYSHFNEKARWVLDYKQVDHTRLGYLPGPHVPAIKKLSGQSQTPVLQWGQNIIAGSNSIIDFVEQQVPDRALYPADETTRLDIQAYSAKLDEELGPATRSLIFSGLIKETAYTANMFSSGKSPMTRLFYRWTFPLVKPIIAKANGVNPENLRHARALTRRYMDDIAERAGETGYLFDSQFTVADLTASALLAPVADVAHSDMRRPQPVPVAVQSVIEEFKDHPTAAWVKSIYEKHRT